MHDHQPDCNVGFDRLTDAQVHSTQNLLKFCSAQAQVLAKHLGRSKVQPARVPQLTPSPRQAAPLLFASDQNQALARHCHQR
jgi:hypothetical protein